MLLSIKNITIHYGGVKAVRNISIDVEAEEIVTLIGANGAGKSTVFRAISGLMPPTSGEIWFRGERTDGLPPYSMVRRGIIQIPEGRRLFPHMTVLGNLKIGAYLRKNRSETNKDLEMVFDRLPILRERRKQEAGTLSGGEQQMLAMGRALLAKPILLLLDEPSLGLAPIIVQNIAQLIKDINKQDRVSIILVEQNAFMALNLADKCYVMEVGEITLEGVAKDLLSNDHVKRAYLGG